MQNLQCLLLTLALSVLVLPAASAQTPPPTWQEKWFEHNQLLKRVYYDDDVAVYFDNDVDRSVTWMNSYMGDVWRYTKSVYGDFSDEGRLYAVFHTGRYSGGHPSTYFDASHDNRDVIDVGPSDWKCGCNNDLDLVTHEVAHIVEGASLGVKGSPAFGIWKDSKWAEIFNYDVYRALGMKKDQQRWYDMMMKQTDNFPRADTQWFKDWFFPIYDQYGEGKVLASFFKLLSENYPTGGNSYRGGMNWGEFVHFWSAAAGANLKPLATQAFGWPAEWDQQWKQAQRDFPLSYDDTPEDPEDPNDPAPQPEGIVTLYRDCDFDGQAIALPEGEHSLNKLRSLGMRNDDVSSLKVKDGYQVTVYQDDNFRGRSLSFTEDEACFNEENFNDELSSVRVSKKGDAPPPPDNDQGQLVQAEDYSSMQGIQTEKTEDAGGGLNVGYIDQGDVLNYAGIELRQSGQYTIAYRVASRRGDSFEIKANRQSLGTVEIPKIGGWQDWKTIEQTVTLDAGTYTFSILANSGEWNINWWRITYTGEEEDDDGDQGWDNFKFPDVVFQDEAVGSEGSRILRKAMPSVAQVMREMCLTVCQKLYADNNEPRVNFQKLNLLLKPDGPVAYKAGSPPEITVGVSTQHLANVYRNNGNSYEAVAQEIRGILAHEGTHAYQWNPKNAGGYQGGTEAYGFIEGTADMVRIQTEGFQPPRSPRPGGNWRDGYTTSGFFLAWIAETKDQDFGIKFNRTARDMDVWSWDKACQKILGKGVQALWDEYQASLQDYVVARTASAAEDQDLHCQGRPQSAPAAGARMSGEALPGVAVACGTPSTEPSAVANTSDKVRVYPNPVVSQMRIQVPPQDRKNSTMRIINVRGQAVWSGDFQPTFDASRLHKGIYSVIIDTPEGRRVQRFVKQ